MLEPGSKATNPRTGSQWELRELGDRHFVLRYTIPAGVSVPEIAEHYHVGWHEDFKVHQGQGFYVLDGQKHAISAGETVALPERARHIHPYSSGAEPMVIEQVGTVRDPAPNAIRETLGFFFTMFDWEAEGRIKLDRIGLPRHPMKFALAGRLLARAGGYDARVPKAIADAGGATVGRIAEILGYQIIDPKWR